MVILENEELRVAVRHRGAELDSIYHKQNKLEYLWNADPAFWGKKSPVLFPIVGSLKDNSYYVGKDVFQMNRHGFARDMEFVLDEKTPDCASFVLTNNLATLKQYPFDFKFKVTYTLHGAQLSVTYLVTNTGSETMYFSVGAHPAFRVPLKDDLQYEDYYLQFNKKETTGRWPISADGLIEQASVPLLKEEDKLPLTKELFYKDAIVLKDLRSTRISLQSALSSNGLHFDFEGFPYLGIWAAKNADFVCIEPWCGIADSTGANQLLPEKEGINSLTAGDSFKRTWAVTIF